MSVQSICTFLYFDMGSCLMYITSICYTDGTKKPYGRYFSGSWTLKMDITKDITDITKESFIFWRIYWVLIKWSTLDKRKIFRLWRYIPLLFSDQSAIVEGIAVSAYPQILEFCLYVNIRFLKMWPAYALVFCRYYLKHYSSQLSTNKCYF